jgi:hypothetical protein
MSSASEQSQLLSPPRESPTTNLNRTPTTTALMTIPIMSPQQINERLLEQKLYESPIKWMSASKRIHGERDIAEKKAELCVKNDRDLIRDWNISERERGDYLTNIKKKIHTFKVSLDAIKSRVTDKPINPYEKSHHQQTKENENLELLLETFESKVASFKLLMKTEFDSLEQNEELLIRDINRVDHMISNIITEESASSFSSHGHGNGGLAHMNNDSSSIDNRVNKLKLQQQQQEDMEHKAAIGEIDRELIMLGKVGGWDIRDHDAFLRVWNGYFGSNEIIKYENNEYTIAISNSQFNHLLKKLEFNVFGKTLDELKEHIDWYTSMLKLLSKKKKLINDWKKIQNIRKRFATQEAVASEQIMLAISKSSSRDSRDGLLYDNKIKEHEEKRQNAKVRIAQWKSTKAKETVQQKLEEEEKAVTTHKQSQEEVRYCTVFCYVLCFIYLFFLLSFLLSFFPSFYRERDVKWKFK